MGFTSTLEDWADKVLDGAARRHFEEEGFAAEWGDEDHQKDGITDIMSADKKTLTLDRYLSGPTKPVTAHDPMGDKNSLYVALKGSEVWNHVKGEYSWAKDSILEFGQASPSASDDLRESTMSAASGLCADGSWPDTDGLERDFSGAYPGTDLTVPNAHSEMENWDGNFAETFRLSFGDGGKLWDEILQGNFYLGVLLTDAADAQTAAIAAARRDVVAICDETLTALDSLEDEDTGLAPILSIAGAVVGASLSIASFGTAAALVGAAFAITTTIVSTAESSGENSEIPTGDGEEFSITGEDAFNVLNSMCLKLNEVSSKLSDQENQIKDALWDAYNGVLGNRDKYELKIAESPDQLGDRLSGETETLKTVAVEEFPAAAAPLFKANSDFAGLDGSGAFVSEVTGSANAVQMPWQAVRDLLVDLTKTNAGTIRRTGKALLGYADDVGVVDGETADDLDDEYSAYEPEESGREHEPYEPPSRPPHMY